MARRVFIGDVHGHYDGLMQLLDEISLASDDRLYFVGDLIDRGPKSAQVVEFVRAHADGCVLGNHEQLLLEAFPKDGAHLPMLQGWLYSGGQATLSSYTDVEKLLEDVAWIRSLPLYLDLDDIWLVHAGVNPRLPVDQQTQQELCWIRNVFHASAEAYFDDKLIITGHTITFTLPGVLPGQIAQGRGWIDIDTGAYHPKSGWLTAVDMDNRQVHQVNVFQKRLRSRALEDAMFAIEPTQVRPRQPQVAKP
ncbi:MAG: metallophosphoesterase family protein [Cyanobacteria bacterium P01_A01_bin.123]